MQISIIIIYFVLTYYYSGEKLEMTACMAYGQVTAAQVPPSAKSEGVYDNV